MIGTIATPQETDMIVKIANKEIDGAPVEIIIAYFPSKNDVEVVKKEDVTATLDAMIEAFLGQLTPEEAFALTVAREIMKQV